MKVYLLWHTHELTDGFGTHEEEKLIGVFSTNEKASDTIEMLKNLEGFQDYSLNNFIIDEIDLDKPYWTEGFSTVRWNE